MNGYTIIYTKCLLVVIADKQDMPLENMSDSHSVIAICFTLCRDMTLN